MQNCMLTVCSKQINKMKPIQKKIETTEVKELIIGEDFNAIKKLKKIKIKRKLKKLIKS